MGFFDSRVSNFLITTASSGLVNISAYITGLEGIPGPRLLDDVTTLGAVGHRYIAGLEEGTFTIELVYSEDANAALTGATDYTFGLLRTLSTAVAFSYYPGSTTGKLYSGNLWIDDYTIKTRIGSSVLATVKGKVDNGVTRT